MLKIVELDKGVKFELIDNRIQFPEGGKGCIVQGNGQHSSRSLNGPDDEINLCDYDNRLVESVSQNGQLVGGQLFPGRPLPGSHEAGISCWIRFPDGSDPEDSQGFRSAVPLPRGRDLKKYLDTELKIKKDLSSSHPLSTYGGRQVIGFDYDKGTQFIPLDNSKGFRETKRVLDHVQHDLNDVHGDCRIRFLRSGIPWREFRDSEDFV